MLIKKVYPNSITPLIETEVVLKSKAYMIAKMNIRAKMIPGLPLREGSLIQSKIKMSKATIPTRQPIKRIVIVDEDSEVVAVDCWSYVVNDVAVRLA